MFVSLIGLLAVATPQDPDRWHGHAITRFEVLGRKAYVVQPETAAPGRPWVWRARFPEFHREIDEQLVTLGWHVGHVDVSNLYGSDAALDIGDAFYARARERFELAPRVVLEGVSRGGLFVYRWAARHPGRTAAIYAESPVCDLLSWPGGKGEGMGSELDWQRALQAWELDDDGALRERRFPLYRLEPLAGGRIPLLTLVGPSDAVVPFAENAEPMQEAYRKIGGRAEVRIQNQGPYTLHGHHFPLRKGDTERALAFIRNHGSAFESNHHTVRRGVRRALAKMKERGSGHVAFLGGSITHNPGWQNIAADDIRSRLPGCDLKFTNAGVPSFCSPQHAFRVERDVLEKGAIDILFFEAAVNDLHNGRGPRERIRGMEGVIRRVRRDSPDTDIVVLHFADPGHLKSLRQGKQHPVIADHERVAAHYDAASIDLAAEVQQRIEAGELDWRRDVRNVHPSPFGQALYASAIERLLDASTASAPKPTGVAEPTGPLPAPIDADSWTLGMLIPAATASVTGDFERVDSWRPADGAGTRAGFVRVPMLVADQPGESLEMPFDGTAIGIQVAAGPDAGIVEWSVDGSAWQRTDLFTRWSRGLHLPWMHVLADGLTAGHHVLRLRIANDHNERSKGHAVRIAALAVNRLP